MKTQDLWQMFKYILSGGIAFLADIIVLFVLVEYLFIHYLASTTIAFIASLSINYFISRYFIFTKTTLSNYRSYSNFFAVSLFGLAAINIFMYIMVDFMNIHYLIARIILAGTIGVGSFYLHKHITFKVSEWEPDHAITKRFKNLVAK